MTEPGPPGKSRAALEAPAPPSMTAWGRRAAKVYLGISALALVAMLVETVLGHAGTGTMFAAILAAPWSMLVASFAPRLPMDWPMAAGLAVRMVPLALFMLLNSLIIASIAARSERDLSGRGARAVVLLALAGVLSSGCVLTTKQVVIVAEPTAIEQYAIGDPSTGVVGVWQLQFDLGSNPVWSDHRGSIRDVTDLAFLGNYGNPSNSVPVDVEIAGAPGLLDTPAPLPPVVWGTIQLEPAASHRVGWNEGAARMKPSHAIVRQEMAGNGKLTLFVTVGAPGHAGLLVEDFRVGAVLHVR